MTVPGQFPRRMSRAASVTAAAPVGVPADSADGSPRAAAPGSWLWRRAALLLAIAGRVTHAGLFFVPALAGLAGAAVRLWREEP
jgi:hypothetical protein